MISKEEFLNIFQDFQWNDFNVDKPLRDELRRIIPEIRKLNWKLQPLKTTFKFSVLSGDTTPEEARKVMDIIFNTSIPDDYFQSLLEKYPYTPKPVTKPPEPVEKKQQEKVEKKSTSLNFPTGASPKPTTNTDVQPKLPHKALKAITPVKNNNQQKHSEGKQKYEKTYEEKPREERPKDRPKNNREKPQREKKEQVTELKDEDFPALPTNPTTQPPAFKATKQWLNLKQYKRVTEPVDPEPWTGASDGIDITLNPTSVIVKTSNEQKEDIMKIIAQKLGLLAVNAPPPNKEDIRSVHTIYFEVEEVKQ
ncbi:hypothetical protein TVAG_431710 [Trichomonas vaginalis G3]|uniref:Uncharacterized protein n=1 Tax=Trichomonas vaginalis (strain ATCC PRA-98 / G3) TaxID=412133 RepID=A2G0H3_TRIV3|nr:hypothetical protein TVAGG3_0246230 [Trichomonas vaginalis G3]EAX89348.1 hypothetical protein TVAG_431710 [Trichomonas vaginalis G3]KAI5553676.1 hypothetical protein TVAGG3_0246230 [Trichomonas vaginalis G3]|eukprot:XP_001302278.1 hypothetical protein [Trichomonas vaginalis G3]